MKTIKGYPPNYAQILEYLSPPKDAVFAYGETIFNPSGENIPEDILFHEYVHSQQQLSFPSPDLWWNEYLINVKFRYLQELEAYANQLNFIKKHIPKAYKEALFELASNLSGMYNIPISHLQASERIRLKAKEITI